MVVSPISGIKASFLDKETIQLDNGTEPALDALRDMALFVAVAEARSFTSASKKLGLPTSTLSWRINEFEQLLGTKLFNRSTRRVELTTTGWLHLERCQQLVRDAKLLTDEMRAQSVAPQGRIRLSTTTDFATCLLSPLLPEFIRRYPNISIDLDLSATRVDLLGDKLDLAIRMGSLPDSGLIARHLMDAHLNLYASPTYLREAGSPATPAALHQHQCIKAGPTPGELTWILSRRDERAEIKLPARFWSNQIGVTRALVIQGLGIGLLVEELFWEDIEAGRLVRVLPEWSCAPTAVSAVVPARQVPARTRVFVDYLVEEFSRAAGSRRRGAVHESTNEAGSK